MVMIIMIRYQRSCIRWCRQPVLDYDHGHQDVEDDGDDYDNSGDDNYDDDYDEEE